MLQKQVKNANCTLC